MGPRIHEIARFGFPLGVSNRTLWDVPPETHQPDMPSASKLLEAAAAGDQQAADRLLPLVYTQLRAVAQQRMQHERVGHSLTATALVHEAYMRLVGESDPGWDGQAHFFAAAGEAMRRVLIEHARKRNAQKRGGGAARQRLRLDRLDLSETAMNSAQVVALDEALRRMEAQDPRMARVVWLRYLAGLSVEQTSRLLEISVRTVKRDWAFARAWLTRELECAEDPECEGADESSGLG